MNEHQHDTVTDMDARKAEVNWAVYPEAGGKYTHSAASVAILQDIRATLHVVNGMLSEVSSQAVRCLSEMSRTMSSLEGRVAYMEGRLRKVRSGKKSKR